MAVDKFTAGALHQRQVAFLNRGPWKFIQIDPPRYYKKHLHDGSVVEARLCTEHCNICGQQICDPVRLRNPGGDEALLGMDCYETSEHNLTKAYRDARSGLLRVKKTVTARRKGEKLSVVLAPLVEEMKRWAAVGAGKAAEVATNALRIIESGRRPSPEHMAFIERLRAEWVEPSPILTEHGKLLAALDMKGKDSTKERERAAARHLAYKIREQAAKGHGPTPRQLQEADELLGHTAAAAPTGPTKVRGTVVYTKVQQGDYGETLKMLVVVPVNDGKYKVWSTIPRALLDAADKALENETGLMDALVRCEVEFEAKLKPKPDEPDFAFADRPSKAKLLSWPKEKERR